MDFPRRLEHSWRDGPAYFVTWRLDGSLPVARVTDFLTSDGPKFVAFDRLLDAVPAGPRWLERPDTARIDWNALWEGQRECRYELGAWAVLIAQMMPCPITYTPRFVLWAVTISLRRSEALKAAAHAKRIGY